MPRPPRKDWFDIAIDFFFGAIFGCCAVVYGVFHFGNIGRITEHGWFILLGSGILVCGASAALCRSKFWERYERYYVIPPTEESLSRMAYIVLTVVLTIGSTLPLLLLAYK